MYTHIPNIRTNFCFRYVFTKTLVFTSNFSPSLSTGFFLNRNLRTNRLICPLLLCTGSLTASVVDSFTSSTCSNLSPHAPLLVRSLKPLSPLPLLHSSRTLFFTAMSMFLHTDHTLDWLSTLFPISNSCTSYLTHFSASLSFQFCSAAASLPRDP